MKSKILTGIFFLSIVAGMATACGGARKREMRARERERRHQESKDQLDRDKKNFNSTFDKSGNDD